MRVMTSKHHLMRDNLLLSDLEDIGRKDEEYYRIVQAIRTGGSFKTLPSESEGRKIGGEWNSLKIMKEAEIVYLDGTYGIDRIYPPKAYRSKILETICSGDMQLDAAMERAILHYAWPK